MVGVADWWRGGGVEKVGGWGRVRVGKDREE